jgi:hypothetical protein
MAIIYSYPRLNTTAATGDLLLITDINDDNKTKSVAISNLPFTNNSGTVTSVGISMPSAFAVANSPITGSDTIAITTTGGNPGEFLAYNGTWATPSLGTGTQYKLPMWATTTTLGDSIVAQDSGGTKLVISGDIEVEDADAVNIDVKTTNASGFGIRINSGIYGGTSPSIGPIGTTGGGAILQFGTQTSGQQFDFKNNKIVFDSDSTNTFIQADTATPENLEVHADQNIKLLADSYVVIESSGNVPTSSSSTGVRGSIKFDTDYLFICVGTDTWRRAELATF